MRNGFPLDITTSPEPELARIPVSARFVAREMQRAPKSAKNGP